MRAMHMRLSDFTTDLDQQRKASAAVGLALSKDTYLHSDGLEAFTQRGFGRFVKTAVDPILSTDTGVSDVPLNAAFLAQTDRTSAIGKLIALGVTTIPLGGASRLQVGTVVAEEVEEGALKPIAGLAFSLGGLPRKTAATIVLSADAARSLAPQMQTGLTSMLASAVAAASDRLLVSLLTAGAQASDATIGGVLAALVNASRPAVIASLDTLLAASGVVRDLDALGIPVIVSPAATGVMIALDLDGVLLDSARIELATAKHATITLDDGLGGSPEGQVVNLWQRNLVALRAERFLQVAWRDGAIAWASTGSPA